MPAAKAGPARPRGSGNKNQDRLTLDHVRLFALGCDKLDVQRLGSRGCNLAEDKGAVLVGARDTDDVRGGHGIDPAAWEVGGPEIGGLG